MRLFICLSSAFSINDERGKLSADWKTDLAEEEDEDYLPEGYSYKKVLELSLIESNVPNSGAGRSMMLEFLASPAAKRAELIFLDPNPGLGANYGSNVPEQEQVRRLQKFYSQFGFKHRPHASRMWLVRKGTIADAQLPT